MKCKYVTLRTVLKDKALKLFLVQNAFHKKPLLEFLGLTKLMLPLEPSQ